MKCKRQISSGVAKNFEFGEDGISPVGLLLGALPFTFVVAAMFLLF